MKFLIFLFVFSISVSLVAQNNTKIDSLLKVLSSSNESDTATTTLLKNIADYYSGKDPAKSVEYSKRALAIAKKLDYKQYAYYYHLAYAQDSNGEFEESIKNYMLCIKESEKQASPLKEDFLSRAYSGLAGVYSGLDNHKMAISYGEKSEKLAESVDDNGFSKAISVYNTGNYYLRAGQVKEARAKYALAKSLYEQCGDLTYMSYVCNSIGATYTEKIDSDTAIKYYEEAIAFSKKYNPEDESLRSIAKSNIGNAYMEMGKNELAIKYFLEASKELEAQKDGITLTSVLANLGVVYERVGDYKNSNLYFRMYVGLRDSMYSDETQRLVSEMSVKYESEKKEKENILLTAQNQKRQTTIYIITGGLVLVIGILFLIFRNSRQKTKANLLLEEKNNIIEQKSAIVEEQNKDIKDSIKYAQRIQSAILPPDKVWNKIVPNSFLLYLPKDILSGDFYWVEETAEFIFLAAADCTGHGVPGALVSIINYNLLNKAVLEKGITKPSEILDAVNVWLTESLHQTYQESTVKDGMDISLISINKKTKEVLFAGANNPIYVVSNNELIEYKADKFPVGAFMEEQQQLFTTKSISVSSNDIIYLFSDGFADQFGGEKGKKYKYKQLQDKLRAIATKPMSEQREILFNEFESWKGKNEQVDDVLLIGLKMI